jgi:glucose-6-phosphate 1-dehydrogenase
MYPPDESSKIGGADRLTFPSKGRHMSTAVRPRERSATTARDTTGAEPADVFVVFGITGGEGATPYEVLLHAAMIGDSKRFTRQLSVEEAWRVMQPLLDAPPPVHPYEKGSWGPAAANDLVAADGGWRGPWVAS